MFHQKFGNGNVTAMDGNKLVTARFFMERMPPETAAHLARIQTGAGAIMELPEEAF